MTSIVLYRPHRQDIIVGTAIEKRVNYDSKYVKRVEELIYNSVRAIVDELERVQPLFRISELVKVGGFNEGTKVLKPNEFDYLAVLGELSHPGDVRVELHPKKSGIARLKLKEELNQDGKWNAFLSDGYVRCMQLDLQTGNDARNMRFEIFGRDVMKAIFNLNKEGRRSFRQFTEIAFTDNPREYWCSVYELKQACIRFALAKFPNVLLEYTVDGKKIEVDLCPAIRCYSVSECFLPEKCISTNLSELVQQRGSILMVGQTDTDVRVTYTETEVDYVRNKMLERHRLLYIYLKFVATVVKTYHWTWLTSYMLKTACIRHDLECRVAERKSHECLRDVLDMLHVCVANGNFPSVFNTDINLVAKLVSLEDYTILGTLAYLKMVPRLLASGSSLEYHAREIHELMREASTVYDPNATGYGHTLFQCEILYSRLQ